MTPGSTTGKKVPRRRLLPPPPRRTPSAAPRPPRRFSCALRRGRAAPHAQGSAEWMHFYVAVLPTGEITGFRDDASDVSDDVRTSLGFVSASGAPPALEDAPSSFTAGDKTVTVDVSVAVGARHPLVPLSHFPLVTGKGLPPAQHAARGAGAHPRPTVGPQRAQRGARRRAGPQRRAGGGAGAWGLGALDRSTELSPPPLRTKWTRRVPRPVLIGHAASLTP
jgi:hypothetical protein